jgi:multiple sugar transport system permease protein
MKTLMIRAQARNSFEIAMASLALLYLLLFAGVPLVYNVVLSFQNVDLMSPAFLARPFAGLSNYLDVMARPETRRVVANTLVFVGVSLVFQVSGGFLLALLFMQRFPAVSFMRGLFLAGWIMPGLVTGAIWKLVFAGDYGVLNHVLMSLGLIHAKVFWLSDPNLALYSVIIANIWVGVPFNMLLLSVGLNAIPAEIY